MLQCLFVFCLQDINQFWKRLIYSTILKNRGFFMLLWNISIYTMQVHYSILKMCYVTL